MGEAAKYLKSAGLVCLFSLFAISAFWFIGGLSKLDPIYALVINLLVSANIFAGIVRGNAKSAFVFLGVTIISTALLFLGVTVLVERFSSVGWVGGFLSKWIR